MSQNPNASTTSQNPIGFRDLPALVPAAPCTLTKGRLPPFLKGTFIKQTGAAFPERKGLELLVDGQEGLRESQLGAATAYLTDIAQRVPEEALQEADAVIAAGVPAPDDPVALVAERTPVPHKMKMPNVIELQQHAGARLESERSRLDDRRCSRRVLD